MEGIRPVHQPCILSLVFCRVPRPPLKNTSHGLGGIMCSFLQFPLDDDMSNMLHPDRPEFNLVERHNISKPWKECSGRRSKECSVGELYAISDSRSSIPRQLNNHSGLSYLNHLCLDNAFHSSRMPRDTVDAEASFRQQVIPMLLSPFQSADTVHQLQV